METMTIVALALSIFAMAACLGIAIYVLIYWSDITEIWSDIFPRILIVIGLFMTYYIPILIPIDITL